MYCRKASYYKSKRHRTIKRVRSILCSKLSSKHLSKGIRAPKQKDEGTKIPVGIFNKRAKRTLPNAVQTKVLSKDKIIPLKNNGKSYTEMNPVTPIEILKLYANADNVVSKLDNVEINKEVPKREEMADVEVPKHDEMADVDVPKHELYNQGKSYTLINPVFSVEILKQYANADVDYKIAETLEAEQSRMTVGNEDEPNDLLDEDIPDDHGDENNAESKSSIQIKSNIPPDTSDEEENICKLKSIESSNYKMISEPNETLTEKKNTRIPIRMKQLKRSCNWAKTNIAFAIRYKS
ncbi:hypothetical protein M8J77_003392 [Diaphorina citri]|nr:hypothetical protein M8J77_003392 [Diaphorina citri]